MSATASALNVSVILTTISATNFSTWRTPVEERHPSFQYTHAVGLTS